MATLTSETVLLTKDSSSTLAVTRNHSNKLYFIPLQVYPNSTPSPLPSPLQPDTAALTSAAHTHPQAYVFANIEYNMSTLLDLLRSTCPCDNKVAVVHGGKCVRMPNGETMVATHTYLLPLPHPPPSFPEVRCLPGATTIPPLPRPVLQCRIHGHPHQ